MTRADKLKGLILLLDKIDDVEERRRAAEDFMGEPILEREEDEHKPKKTESTTG